MQNMKFPWSDNWWIEDNKAWFCAGEIGALFCVDMESEECKLIARIPECNIYHFRQNSYCIKYENAIFCFPSMGDCVWYYNIKTTQWNKLVIGNTCQLFLCIESYKNGDPQICFWDIESKLYVVDLEKKILKRKYQTLNEAKAEIGEYVLRRNKFYGVYSNKVVTVDLNQHDIRTIVISDVKADLYTICFDGTDFWLSGFGKEIYVWNSERGIIKVINDFPKEFGLNDFTEDQVLLVDTDSFFSDDSPFFLTSFLLGKYIWYIPFQANEIIYINKETYGVFALSIPDELETRESLMQNYMGSKFLMQYIRDDRYIGMYSFKNHRVFEIDSVELTVTYRDYKLDHKSVLMIEKAAAGYHNGKILNERREKDRKLFSRLLEEKNESSLDKYGHTGELIYHTLHK